MWSIIGNPFPKISDLVKARANSMSKAASLFKWPFVTRLLGLGHIVSLDLQLKELEEVIQRYE